LMTERDSGKAKGFGFCEYKDPQHAQSAIRNLNNQELHSRSLRVALAEEALGDDERSERRRDRDKDPSSSTSSSSIGANVQNRSVPPGLEIIVKLVDSLSKQQLIEILTEMKKFIHQNPDGARQLLMDSPQVAQTLLRILLLFNLVRQSDIQVVAQRGSSSLSEMKRPPPTSSADPRMQPPMPLAQSRVAPPVPGLGRGQAFPSTPGPQPMSLSSDVPRQGPMPGMRPMVPTGSAPPIAPPAVVPSAGLSQLQQQLAHLPPQQQAVLREVIKLSPDQIALLPSHVQQQVYQLKSQLGNAPLR